ncbi:hypothetical protein, partial [Klebsiella pneumoniae]
WKPPAHSPEENMVRQKCSGIRRSYLAFCANNISPVMALNTKTGGYRPLPVLSLARFPFPHYTAITHQLTE